MSGLCKRLLVTPVLLVFWRFPNCEFGDRLCSRLIEWADPEMQP